MHCYCCTYVHSLYLFIFLSLLFNIKIIELRKTSWLTCNELSLLDVNCREKLHRRVIKIRILLELLVEICNARLQTLLENDMIIMLHNDIMYHILHTYHTDFYSFLLRYDDFF